MSTHTWSKEELFAACSSLMFRRTSREQTAAVVLCFPDIVTASHARQALLEWAKDRELIVALSRKVDGIEATLIHTGQQQVLTMSELSFNADEYSEFLRIETQDRPLLIECRAEGIAKDTSFAESRSLFLLRYVATQ